MEKSRDHDIVGWIMAGIFVVLLSLMTGAACQQNLERREAIEHGGGSYVYSADGVSHFQYGPVANPGAVK